MENEGECEYFKTIPITVLMLEKYWKRKTKYIEAKNLTFSHKKKKPRKIILKNWKKSKKSDIKMKSVKKIKHDEDRIREILKNHTVKNRENGEL